MDKNDFLFYQKESIADNFLVMSEALDPLSCLWLRSSGLKLCRTCAWQSQSLSVFSLESLFLYQWVKPIPHVSSIRLIAYGLLLRTLIHLELSFVQSDDYGSIFILLYSDIQFNQQHLLKMLCFLQHLSHFFVKSLVSLLISV